MMLEAITRLDEVNANEDATNFSCLQKILIFLQANKRVSPSHD